MERTMRDEWYPQRRRTPSFSSTLLDAIYRSIDESKSNLDEDQQMGLYKETTHIPKQNNSSYNNQKNCGSVEKSGNNQEKVNLRRAVMIEDWIEKQSSQNSQLLNSTSSSSESTSGAWFSSSETDTTTHKTKPKPKPRPKSEWHVKKNNNNSEKQQQQQKQKPKREGVGGFARTKLRALKIYGELNQKVKQPISPGSRIASFLSSIFSTGNNNVKKAKKMCYVGAVEDVNFEHKSKSPRFSSSASSFSRRSCMSKTPSSTKAKRSVRFYPVSMILGEDSQPSCHRYTYENDPSLLPLPSVRKMKEVKKNNCVMTKENGFMKGYQSSCKGNQFGFRGFYDNGEEGNNYDEDDDDDEALSYSSSDLFELDHLIGAGRYQEELPVYETTNLETNKAIANGLRL